MQFSVRMPEELRNELVEMAAADDRSLASYITRALQEHVDAKKAKAEEKQTQ